MDPAMLEGFSEEDKAKMMGMIEAMQTRDRCVDETRRDERRGEGYTNERMGETMSYSYYFFCVFAFGNGARTDDANAFFLIAAIQFENVQQPSGEVFQHVRAVLQKKEFGKG